MALEIEAEAVMVMEDELVKRLRAARAYAGVSRDDVVEALGMSASTYDRIERGLREVKTYEWPAIVDTMSALCGLPPAWFTVDFSELGSIARPPQEEPTGALSLEVIVDAVLARLNGADVKRPPSDADGHKARRAPGAGGKRPKR